MKCTAGVALFGAALYNALGTFAAFLDTNPYEVTSALSDVLNAANKNSSLVTYPTDMTRNLVPKFIHSHNDYWRDIPFYSALSVGAVSVEADVWLINDTLYVGHERSALTPNRTFAALYVNPIMAALTRMNPQTAFTPSQTHNGLFDTDAAQTLYLWIDLKTDAASTFPAVVAALAPLRAAGYLTTASNDSSSSSSKPAPRPVTAIGTGNTARADVEALRPRDVFYDAPLADLPGDIGPALSPIASTDFGAAVGSVRTGGLNDSQRDTVRRQVGAARAQGVGARYWDTPGWPVHVRDGVWRDLWEEGVTLINVDDLVAGAGYAGAQQGHW